MSKDPDTRYQPMRDDRGSFIKTSQTNLGNTELDALGATARGDPHGNYGYAEHKRMDLEDEDDSMASSLAVNQTGQYDRSRSPIAPPNQTLMRDGYNRTGSPYSAPGSGYASPYTQRSAPQSRSQNDAQGSIWQRGVGY